MRTTIALDDKLVRQAQQYTGISEKAALVREALQQLVLREAARRLAALGGSDPNAAAAPRRRVAAFADREPKANAIPRRRLAAGVKGK